MERSAFNDVGSRSEDPTGIEENPHVSAKQLAEKVGISSRKIEENIKKLKDKGIIARIEPAKGGYWKIISELFYSG